ncbi:MAG: cyclase family protein [Gammaproteobacteria bacterium]|nr:cyclase family protein [Gammaproteobacteria bacterium]
MNRRWVNRPEGANWGEFGADDQRGRLNLLTPDKVREGAAEVREGLSFCLSLPLDMPGGNAVNPKRRPPVLGPVYEKGGLYYNFLWNAHIQGSRDITSDEYVTLYSQYSTQWDSFAHVGMLFDADADGEAEPVYYNGYRAYEHVGGPKGSENLGAKALGIENMAETGVQGRAVLVDFHRHFGEERVAVGRDLLMDVFQKDGITVEPGDMFLFHTGWDDLIMGMAGEPDADRLHSSCAVLDGFDPKLLQWITDSKVSVIATDNMAVEDSRGFGDTQDGPSRLPLHRHCLFRLGVHLGELWYLSELTAALRQRERFRFLLTAPPLRLPGAVGSPVTPVATI